MTIVSGSTPDANVGGSADTIGEGYKDTENTVKTQRTETTTLVQHLTDEAEPGTDNIQEVIRR